MGSIFLFSGERVESGYAKNIFVKHPSLESDDMERYINPKSTYDLWELIGKVNEGDLFALRLIFDFGDMVTGNEELLIKYKYFFRNFISKDGIKALTVSLEEAYQKYAQDSYVTVECKYHVVDIAVLLLQAYRGYYGIPNTKAMPITNIDFGDPKDFRFYINHVIEFLLNDMSRFPSTEELTQYYESFISALSDSRNLEKKISFEVSNSWNDPYIVLANILKGTYIPVVTPCQVDGANYQFNFKYACSGSHWLEHKGIIEDNVNRMVREGIIKYRVFN